MRKNPFGKDYLEKENFASQKGSNPPPAGPSPSANIVLLSEDLSGRDEMNLAGNPFALLQADSKRANPLSIRYEWERRLPNGKIVMASWEVQGGGRLGLPGPAEELLYLVLLQLTRESCEGSAEVWPLTVHFSRSAVLERMGWSRTPKFYGALRDCFARLQAVSIQADHAFWDARLKTPYSSVGFAILDDYAIADEPKGRKGEANLPLSWFRWNSTLHASFTAGNVRGLALDFVLSLDHPTARRLFRFLDMHRKAEKPPRREFSIGVMKLRDRLGMTGYKYVSKVKEKLSNAHEELIARGYLESVEYAKSKDGGELVLYHFGEVRPFLVTGEQAGAEPSGQITVLPRSIETAIAIASEPDVRADAVRCHQIFLSLSEAEKNQLRERARSGVAPIFWDRLESPDSPISLTLWELVAQTYPEA